MQRSAILPARHGTGHRLPASPVLALPARRTPGDVAAVIAGRLAAGELATAVLADLMRREISVRVLGPHVRPAEPAEAALLRLGGGAVLYVRDGLQMAGTITCARTVLKLHEGRVRELAGDDAWKAIRGGEPCGKVLGELLRRIARKVEVPDGGGPAVTASAVLAIGVVRIGHAAEVIPADLCQRLAARA